MNLVLNADDADLIQWVVEELKMRRRNVHIITRMDHKNNTRVCRYNIFSKHKQPMPNTVVVQKSNSDYLASQIVIHCKKTQILCFFSAKENI